MSMWDCCGEAMNATEQLGKKCPRCGADQWQRAAFYPDGSTKYRCVNCEHRVVMKEDQKRRRSRALRGKISGPRP